MPPRLDDETRRLNTIMPAALVKRIDDWRRQQPNLPTMSEAVRRLVELGLDAPAATASYRIEDLVKGITPKNRHPELLTGAPVGRQAKKPPAKRRRAKR
jgi:hypothetical protein